MTAAMPLRVVEGASKFIEGASLYKTFTTGLSPVEKPYNRPAGVGNAFPLWWLAPPPFPLFEGAQQPVLTVETLMKRMFRGVLFCPLNREKSGAAG